MLNQIIEGIQQDLAGVLDCNQMDILTRVLNKHLASVINTEAASQETKKPFIFSFRECACCMPVSFKSSS